jgi:hypothetical protein
MQNSITLEIQLNKMKTTHLTISFITTLKHFTKALEGNFVLKHPWKPFSVITFVPSFPSQFLSIRFPLAALPSSFFLITYHYYLPG